MMYAGKLSYFVQIQAQYELSALSSKAKTGLLAGKGIFGYEPKVDYFFGLPRSISSGGIHLDIETTRVVRALDNDQQKTIDFAIQTGPIGSALEHALKEVPLGCQVPEQMFNTNPANPTQAISTVKALQLANAQGQQIYKIDNTNIDEVLPKLNLSDTIKQDIQSSVNAGKYVITHTDNVSVPGWSGAGYAIIDPTTGSDAYLISGGENGGFKAFGAGLEQIAYGIYALIDLVWNNMPEAASLAVHTVLGEIIAFIDNVRGLLTIYENHGLVQALIGWLILSMLTQMTVLLLFAAGAIATSTGSFLLMSILITYTMASIFNLVASRK